MDVAIIGAGINGASAAQHLSAAGYSVLVVDQGDFANGATSRSSRLLHCGLRHLATGSSIRTALLRPDRLARDVAVVRADMLARDEIVRTIPHRVKAFNFCLPIYADDPYAPWQLDAAFFALRAMSPRGVPLDYRRYSPKELDAVPITPWLRDKNKLRSVAVFREYQFDWAERIALDALFDARRMGAEIHNYTRLTAIKHSGKNGRWRLTLCSSEDVENDDVGADREAIEVTADLVLNLAGAWIDDIIQKTGNRIAKKCAGMKGIHIAVRLPDEFIDWGVFAFNSIGEPLYCLPWHGMHYIGLTRTPFEGDIAAVSASDQEIDWMISETNRCLPKLAITRSEVVFSWAGVNPLTFDPENPLGSREIKIHDLASEGLPNILTLTGGPIMTHRRVATRLVDLISERLAPSRVPQEPNFQLNDPSIEGDAPRLTSEFTSISTMAIERCAGYEQPRNLADLLMRRLGLGWTPDQGLALARPVAEVAAPHLGWSQERIDAEVANYKVHLETARRRPAQMPIDAASRA